MTDADVKKIKRAKAAHENGASAIPGPRTSAARPLPAAVPARALVRMIVLASSCLPRPLPRCGSRLLALLPRAPARALATGRAGGVHVLQRRCAALGSTERQSGGRREGLRAEGEGSHIQALLSHLYCQNATNGGTFAVRTHTATPP